MNNLRSLLTAVLISLLFAGCDDGADGILDPDVDETLAEVLQEDGRFTKFTGLLDQTEILTKLNENQYTIFAPTDEAISSLSDGFLESLSSTQLESILTYHIVEGAISSSQIGAGTDIMTTRGQLILVLSETGSYTVNGKAEISERDIPAANGIIHVIDKILLPEEFRDPSLLDIAGTLENFNIFLNLVEDTGLTTTLTFTGPYTLFLPTDNAFNRLPPGLLESLSTSEQRNLIRNHIVPGEFLTDELSNLNSVTSVNNRQININLNQELRVILNNRAVIILSDIQAAENGLIQIVDEVLQ